MHRKIFLALPSHSGHVTMPTHLSIGQARTEAHAHGWEIKEDCIGGDADIARVRNAYLAKFLDSDATDLFFVDADISWGPGTFLSLMTHEEDFVAGVYRQRTDERMYYPVRWSEPRIVRNETGSPLIAADFVPGGFWKLSRACVKQVVEKCCSTLMVDPTLPDIKTLPWVFDFERMDGTRLSEDFVFCKKWRSIGGKIWVDPTLCIDHTGMKTFQGNLLESLRQETVESEQNASLLDRARFALAS